MTDEDFMQQALREAQKAARSGEIPVGAIGVRRGKIIARAHNMREARADPLGHAEMILLRKLSQKIKTWRLLEMTLYVTLEPCLMCMGALIQSRIPRLVFGTFDPKAGACGSLYDVSQDRRLNHQIKITSRVLEAECRQILKDFFRILRKR